MSFQHHHNIIVSVNSSNRDY